MTITRQSAEVHLTLLSSILGANFPLALERQKAIGIQFLDLKDGLWGKSVEQLDEEEAIRAAKWIDEFAMQVHCFSTSVGHSALEPDMDETAFRARHEPALENALSTAKVLRPQVIRLLAPRLAPTGNCVATAHLQRSFPWVVHVYRDWIDRIDANGFGILIENEASGCLLGSVEDVQTFFALLDRPTARYTWDVQNLWQNGTFPSLDVYQQLRPLMGALHLKGGRADEDGNLLWASALDAASWPVLDIVRAVVADCSAPYICLNPSHGKRPPNYDIWEIAQHEITWLRREIKEIA